MQTYLFYDLETSGLNPAFDQVYQFAAIRTDLDFHEIERYEFFAKPTIDVIPTLEAMITHRLAIPMLQERGEAECDVIFKIHQLLNTPGTISLGYNTLKFDDEFLRFSFYRHLLSPYTHQFANQCYRMDLFPIVVFYYLKRQACGKCPLVWDEKEGLVSLKLEALSLQNALSVGQAHNAMVDVEATVNLARKLKEDAPLWNSLASCFNKKIEAERLQKLPLIKIAGADYAFGIAVNGKYGAKKSFQAAVLCLGQHWHFKNQTVWLDLNDEGILAGDVALIPELWALKKKGGEPPFIMHPDNGFNQIGTERQTLAESVLDFLKSHPDFFTAIRDYALDFKFPSHPQTDIDAALYLNPFWQNEEITWMQRFWQESALMKSNLLAGLTSKNLQMLSHRYFGRFHPHLHDDEEKMRFKKYLDQIWNQDESGIFDFQSKKRLTRNEGLARIDAFDFSALDTEQQEILRGLKDYLLAV